jgi:acid phosphatase
MNMRRTPAVLLAVLLAAGTIPSSYAADPSWNLAGGEADDYRPAGMDKIRTVVVIFPENRSFDNLWGTYPGADGVLGLKPGAFQQVDRDGKLLSSLPEIWDGISKGGPATLPGGIPNAPFAIDDPKGFNLPASVPTRDFVHRFYQNQMQINGGKNDKFVAWGDSGALVMGYYDSAKLPLSKYAQKYVLADNFFQAAFGGSFLNHQWLICACTPYYPDADKKAPGLISAVEPDGVTLSLAPDSPASAMDGKPRYLRDKGLTPDFYAVNTMQPAYQPSGNAPLADKPEYADPADPKTLPPQTAETIGDLLSAAGVSWAWYGGAWQDALDNRSHIYNHAVPNFVPHHAPFNYFANYAPGTPARAEHLKDGGLAGEKFIADVDAGRLPQVSFYKPQGNLNQHPGYSDVLTGDQHIAEVLAHLEKSPQWPDMLVIVTYDENGGIWDHAAPPKGDRWGPGTRIPALIISPHARQGFIDHTPYDTTSVLRFITKRFNLPSLPGLTGRDAGLKQNGFRRPGDLTNALKLD